MSGRPRGDTTMETRYWCFISSLLYLPHKTLGGRYSETDISDLSVIIPLVIVGVILITLILILLIFYWRRRGELCSSLHRSLPCRDCFTKHTKLETGVAANVCTVNVGPQGDTCNKCVKTEMVDNNLIMMNVTRQVTRGKQCERCACTEDSHCNSILCHVNNGFAHVGTSNGELVLPPGECQCSCVTRDVEDQCGKCESVTQEVAKCRASDICSNDGTIYYSKINVEQQL